MYILGNTTKYSPTYPGAGRTRSGASVIRAGLGPGGQYTVPIRTAPFPALCPDHLSIYRYKNLDEQALQKVRGTPEAAATGGCLLSTPLPDEQGSFSQAKRRRLSAPRHPPRNGSPRPENTSSSWPVASVHTGVSMRGRSCGNSGLPGNECRILRPSGGKATPCTRN